VHFYIWPRNSFSFLASRAPSRCTSLLILARNYVVTILKGIKQASLTEYIYIYIYVISRIKVYYSLVTAYILSTDKHIAHLFKFDFFGTRGLCISIILLYILSIILRYRWIVIIIVISRDYDIAITIMAILSKSL